MDYKKSYYSLYIYNKKKKKKKRKNENSIFICLIV